MQIKLRKVLALLACLAMLCTVLPMGALTSVAAAGDNLVVNGGFEDGEANWSFQSGTHEIVSDAHSGNNALQLTAPGQWGVAAQQSISVNPGSTYIIRWYSKRISGTDCFNLYIVGDYTKVSGQNWMTETSGEWVFNEFIIKPAASAIGLKFSTEVSGNTSTIAIDDLTVVEKPAGFENGDFETGDTTGWTTYHGSTTTTAAAYEGSYGLHAKGSGWGGIAYQDIELKDGQSYQLSFWYNITTAGFNWTFKGNSTTTKYAGTWQNTNLGTWQQVVVDFVADDTSARLNFSGLDGTSSPDFYLDSISIVEVVGPSYDGYVTNGDFECGKLTGWSIWNSTAITTEDAHTGDYSAKLAGAGGWGGLMNQTFTVEVGKTYSLSFWYKNINTNSGVNAKIYSPSTSDTNYKYAYLTNSTWTQVTWEFIASATDGKVTLNFSGPGNSLPEAMYIDDVRMIEVKEASYDGYIYNGDFETGQVTPWKVYQDTTVSTDAAYNGNYGLIAKGNGGWGGLLNQSFAVEANTDYTIKYAVKCVSNGLNIQVRDAANANNLYYVYLDTNKNSEWTKVEAVFNSGNNTIATFQLVGSGKGTTDEVWFDDIVIEKVGGDGPSLNTNLTGGQTSVKDASSDSKGLAFRFEVKASGAQILETNEYVSGSATITPYANVEDDYALIKAGAVVTNKASVGEDADAMALTSVDGKKVIDIPAKYLNEVNENDFAFAVRVLNIPESGLSTNIFARPYYIYEDSEGNEVVLYGNTKSENYSRAANPKASIKILAIGNSFSMDAMHYHLYNVLDAAGYEEISLGNLVIGGCSLDTHWNNINNDSGAYDYYSNTNGGWGMLSSYKLSAALASQDWDYITIQQASPSSGRPGTYGNLPKILNYLNENKTNPNAKILWQMTWAYDEVNINSGYANYNNNQMTMYRSILDTVQSEVLTESLIDGVIPSGTSIQNMRTSDITASLLCESDGYHLSTNYGDYIAALTWYAYISGEDVSELAYQPDAIAPYRDDVNKSVMGAINNPYQITKCDDYDLTKEIKVLSIGHSFSIDVMGTYLYDMLEDAGYEDITIGYLYYPGCSLNRHWEYISTNTNGHERYGKNNNGSWTTINNPYAIDVLRDEDWDIVTLQASPDYVGGENGEYSNIPNITNWIQDNALNVNVDIKWHMIWAYSEDCELWSYTYHDFDQITMYNNIVAATQENILTNDTFTGVIPCGTAIQNGRTSLIGDNFNEPVVAGTQADGYHLNTKYGDFTGSLTWACFLSGVDANEITIRSEGMTEEEFAAIAEAVNNALANPYEVTESTHK